MDWCLLYFFFKHVLGEVAGVKTFWLEKYGALRGQGLNFGNGWVFFILEFVCPKFNSGRMLELGPSCEFARSVQFEDPTIISPSPKRLEH
jgi:hypothetical protein